MNSAITFEELFVWNQETSNFWKAHLDANPSLPALPCTIGGGATVQELVRHIWGVELRWGQRLAQLPVTPKEEMPDGPLDEIFGLHIRAMKIYRSLLDDPAFDWSESMTIDLAWLPPSARTASRRKVVVHALLHGQRHWAQLATLVRAAGFPSGFMGDALFASALV